MKADLVLTNGTVVTEHGPERADVAVRDGRIAAIAAHDAERFDADEQIDVAGLHVFPGGIDPHVHLGDQGQSDFEDFATGTASCAAGGLTTVVDMPLNLPPTVDAATFEARREEVAPKAYVDFGLWGGLVPGNLADLEPMALAGALAFKAFVCEAVDWFRASDGDLLEGMREAARLDRPVGVHSENDDITARLRSRLRDAGRTDLRAHAESRPEVAEWEAINRVVLLAQETGARTQVVHISTGEGVDACTAARRAGTRVGAEVTMHHLTLDEDDMLERGTFAKCAPPLRGRHQVEALWERVLAGDVSNIGSDHSPATFEQKDLARHQHWDVPDGITGTQTLMPLLLSEGVHRRGLPLADFARLTSTAAARMFGLYPRKGAIRVGADADFAIADLEARWMITPEELLYKCPWSPNEGTVVRGRIVRTIVRGTTVFCDGELVGDPGAGAFLHGMELAEARGAAQRSGLEVVSR
jgi:allantoinase